MAADIHIYENEDNYINVAKNELVTAVQKLMQQGIMFLDCFVGFTQNSRKKRENIHQFFYVYSTLRIDGW